jgi:acetyl esterase/lipase
MRRVKRIPGAWPALFLAIVIAAGGIAWAVHQRGRLRQILLPLWVQTTYDVPYGPYADNRLDIMRPRWKAGALRPAVVIFHGGGWIDGGREEMRDRVCRRYLQNGFLVANVEYRRGSIPAAAEDAIRALQWFCSRASSYGVDRSRIVVTGESAGGHLALLAAFRSGAQTAAVVNFYGVTDITALADRASVRALLPPQHPEPAARSLSPVTYVRGGLPPVFSIHGLADQTVPPEQTAGLTSRIKEAGGEAFELYIDGGGHGFSKEHQEIAYGAVFHFLRQRGILRE